MRLLILVLLMCSTAATAQLYRSKGPSGESLFSDRPLRPNAERIESSGPNLIPARSADETVVALPDRSVSKKPIELHFIDLADEQAIRANNGDLTVTVAIDPPLKPTQRLQLLLNGQPHGVPGTSTRFELQSLDRGTHTLAVRLLEHDQTVQTSAPVTVHVLRVHR